MANPAPCLCISVLGRSYDSRVSLRAIFHSIVTSTDNELRESLSWSSNDVRAQVLELLPWCVSCPVHRKRTESRLCLIVSVIGEFSRSLGEVDKSLRAIKLFIGSSPFPDPPLSNWSQECRRRLIQGDAELLSVIVTALMKLFSKLYEQMLHLPKMKSVIFVKRAETVRSLALLWMLPEPVVFGVPPIHEEIKKHMRSLCEQDGDLYSILVSSISSPGNLVSLLSTKLEEYEQKFEDKRKKKWSTDYWQDCLNGEVLKDTDITYLKSYVKKKK